MSNDHPFLNRARRDLARAEISRAKAEHFLQSIEHDIAQLKIFIDRYESYIGYIDQSSNLLRNKVKTRNITDIAVSIIEISEEPLLIQDILDKLYSNGIEVGGENKPGNLAAYLSKDNRVKYERGLGWMPSGDVFLSSEKPSQNDVLPTRDVRQAGGSRPDSDLQRRRGPVSTTLAAEKQALRNTRVEIDDDIPF